MGTMKMPFFLVYGAEEVISLEDVKGSPRVVIYDEATQDQVRHDDLDLLEEKTCRTNIGFARYHQALKCYH
jgi:hypothetical protein